MNLDPRGDLALRCARVCELSYEAFDGATFHQGMSSEGFYNTATVEKIGVEGLGAWNDDTLIVCFRGTDSMADWFADLSSKQAAFADRTIMRHTNMMVHTGFMRTLSIIEREMNEIVERHLEGRKLVVCGHSLGAAMAVLYAMRFHASDVSAVVTFGCPRVGNEAFANDFNKQHAAHSLRFVHNNDVVTRVPWKFMDYSHVWRQQYFDRWGRLHADFKASRVWKWYDGIAGRVHRLCNFKLLGGIEDHDMHEYRRLVQRAHMSV